jgi:hypothetical protein
MPVLVAFVDREGTLGWANRTFCSLFPPAGLEEGEGERAPRIDALLPGIGEELPSLIRDVLETGSAINGIIEPVDVPAGGTRTLKLDILPCTGTTDGGEWVIIFAIDVTEQAGMERLKKEAYEQIEKNIEQFATLGDHIRNPVAVIAGLCDLLEDTATGGKILAQAKEIDRIVDQIDHGWIDSEKVRSMIKKYYDVGVSGTHELVARAIHEEFLHHLKMSGQSPENNPSMLPWNDLPRSLQESNLMQADDIWRKLGEIHCAIGIATESRIQPIVFTPDEVELLAMYEHERWMSERIRRGWIYGTEINISERVHNCLVPWQQLPEYQREKDRNTIRTLPQVLAKVRLKIVRLHV